MNGEALDIYEPEDEPDDGFDEPMLDEAGAPTVDQIGPGDEV